MLAFFTFFAGLVITKAIIEPIATNLGRHFLQKYLDQCCALLDMTLDAAGLEFDAEEVVRKYLDLVPDQLTEKQVDQIVDAVFKEWDLRKVTRKPLA